MRAFTHSMFAHIRSFWAMRKKPILITGGILIFLALLIVGGSSLFEYLYTDRIYPNITIASIPVGGLTERETRDLVEKQFQTMLDQGLTLNLEGQNVKIDLRASGSTDPDLVFDLMDFNADQVAQQAFGARRGFSMMQNPLGKLPLVPVNISPAITVLQDQLSESVRNAFQDAETAGEPTSFEITFKKDVVSVSALEGAAGRLIDMDKALHTLANDTEDLNLSTLTLSIKTENRIVTSEEAESLTTDVVAILSAAPYNVTYTTPGLRDYSWAITRNDLVDWLQPGRDDNDSVIVTLNQDKMEVWFATIHTDIDKQPQNARFLIEDGRVVEFKGSIDGVSLNEDATASGLLADLLTPPANGVLTIAVETVAPTITTGSVNDLGIKEILGVGTSDFSGSPSNRIANITHGAEKLNGLLIPPGEILSLIDHLKPFTIADGYLPELVIKGDEIKPEVGGGLCQIGTTTFRASMNAGLEIVERRNHSLIVSYYDDPSNGKPGTDATIYDPAPDFKVKNDTENYVLLTTEVDVQNHTLVFTFWGTSDGRNAYYTPPQVLSWNGYGSTEYKETPDLPPGVERCQSPHPGATTTFDYIVERPDGTEFKKTFTSVYRSLPRICLVGIDPDVLPPIQTQEDTPASTESTDTTNVTDTPPVE